MINSNIIIIALNCRSSRWKTVVDNVRTDGRHFWRLSGCSYQTFVYNAPWKYGWVRYSSKNVSTERIITHKEVAVIASVEKFHYYVCSPLCHWKLSISQCSTLYSVVSHLAIDFVHNSKYVCLTIFDMDMTFWNTPLGWLNQRFWFSFIKKLQF